VIAQDDQAPLLVFGIDPSRRIGENDGSHPHPSQHAHGKCYFLRAVAFVHVDAALHSSNRNAAGVSDDKVSRMADGGGARKMGDLRIWKADAAG